MKKNPRYLTTNLSKKLLWKNQRCAKYPSCTWRKVKQPYLEYCSVRPNLATIPLNLAKDLPWQPLSITPAVCLPTGSLPLWDTSRDRKTGEIKKKKKDGKKRKNRIRRNWISFQQRSRGSVFVHTYISPVGLSSI